MNSLSKFSFTRFDLNNLPWPWLRPALIILLSLAGGALLVFGILDLQPANQIRPGQILAHDLATAAGQYPGVPLSSGAYLPGSGIILYSRVEFENRAQTLTWAASQLAAQGDRLGEMSQDESLTWIIDYGLDPVHQEIIQAPLARAAESSTHIYYAAPPESPVSTPADQVAPVDIELTGGSVSETVPADPQPVVAAEPVAEVDTDVVGVEPVVETGNVVAAAGPGTPVISQFENGAVGWLPLAGEWVVEAGRYLQTNSVGYDYITMLEAGSLTDYSLEARFRHLEGDLGAGVIYNAPALDNRRGAHLVDLVDGGSFLRWGYYNENGDYSYVGGLQIEPPVADGEWHTLRLVTRGNVSTIYLDDQELASLENQNEGGHVGLLTSQARVEFDDVTLIASPAEEAAGLLALPLAQFEDTFNDGEADGWQIVTGDWQVIDGEYRQLNQAESDQASVSPFQAETYRVQSKIRYLDGAMDGGFTYNMAGPDTLARSQLVGYTADGRALQWGHIDDAGNFVVDGQVEVADGRDGQWHTLQLTVESARALVTLDDQVVADNIPLTFVGGYVGLYTRQGSLAFDDIAMTLNAANETGP